MIDFSDLGFYFISIWVLTFPSLICLWAFISLYVPPTEAQKTIMIKFRFIIRVFTIFNTITSLAAWLFLFWMFLFLIGGAHGDIFERNSLNDYNLLPTGGLISTVFLVFTGYAYSIKILSANFFTSKISEIQS